MATDAAGDRERRRCPIGARLTVPLVFGVALLSVVTGVANMGSTTPLAFADLVPAAVRQVAGDTGTLAGFRLVAAADGGPNG